MTLAWRTELASGPRLVLLALCDNANDSGSCYPSVQALADKCGLSVRSVRSHVADMERLGLLERNERTGRSTYYQISLKALRAAVYKCLAGREHISEFDRGILRACAPDELFAPAPTPANSAAPSDATPANSAAHPGKFCRPPRQILPP
jgi:DNA-binding transcriptional ArsR family regulator